MVGLLLLASQPGGHAARVGQWVAGDGTGIHLKHP